MFVSLFLLESLDQICYKQVKKKKSQVRKFYISMYMYLITNLKKLNYSLYTRRESY